eukprot:TRINITY_DN33087_c0_g1_i2.p1 TRINITY_DN33087_c0_g1~~TRINITY_DN33087_c0_g1_i2.p1  ORF type:complete len:389 (+),score=34.81 TRINITY_DN33087_c0_g1_i2:110-1276(+)
MASLKELEKQLEKRRLEQHASKLALDHQLLHRTSKHSALTPPKPRSNQTPVCQGPAVPAQKPARTQLVTQKKNTTATACEDPSPTSGARAAAERKRQEREAALTLSPTSGSRAAAARRRESEEVAELTQDLSPTSSGRVVAQRSKSQPVISVRVPAVEVPTIASLAAALMPPGCFEDDEKQLHLSSGSMLGGTLSVQGLLGTGVFSRVYRCIETSSDRPMAVKIIRAEDDCINDAQEEARLLAGLQTLHDSRSQRLGLLHGELLLPELPLFYALCFEVLGPSLNSDPIRENIKRDRRMLKTVAFQILDAISFLHDCSILHGDLKPDNLVLCPGRDVKVKVIDLGSARRCLPGAKKSRMIVQTRTYRACLLYTSPSPRDRTRSRMPSSA